MKRDIERAVRGASAVLVLLFIVSAAPAGGPDFASLLQRAKERYGKVDRGRAGLSLVQEWKLGGVTMEAKVYRKGSRFRVESSLPIPGSSSKKSGERALRNVVVCDGTRTWLISPLGGKRRLAVGDVRPDQKAWNWWTWASGKGKVVGRETIGDRTCSVVEVGGGGDFAKLWIDEKNLNMVKGEGRALGGENLQLVNSDFRKVSGNWELPFETRTFLNGRLVSTVSVKSFEVKRRLPDDLFDPDRIKVETVDLEDVMKKVRELGKKGGFKL